MKRLMVLAAMGLAVLTFGSGCSQKTSAERDSLLQQNKALSDEVAALKARADAADARAAAAANSAVTTPADAAPATPDMAETGTTGGRAPAPSDMGGGVTTITNKHGQSVIQISGDVLFDSGKAALKPSAKKSLDKVAGLIKSKYSGQMLRVEGHTDPNPVRSSGWDDNWDLGHARARTVLLYLIEKGVSKKNMYSASFADNDLKSTKNLALDRRVDIVVTNSGK